MTQPNQHTPNNRLIHLAGIAMAVFCLRLTVLSYTANADSLFSTQITFLFLLLLYGMAVLVVYQHGASLRWVFIYAVMFRLLLFPGQPVLNQDINRYLWDGYSLAQGVNPYLYAPQEITDLSADDFWASEMPSGKEKLWTLAQKNENAAEVLQTIPNPEFTTPYFPFQQILFGIVGKIFPFSVLGWRIVPVFFDLALLVCLISLLNYLKKPVSWVLIYGWSPLVLHEAVLSARVEIVPPACLFLAILLMASTHRYRAAGALSCTVMSQPGFAFLLPYWLGRLAIKGIVVFALIVLFLVFPFMDAGMRGCGGLVLPFYQSDGSGCFSSIFSIFFHPPMANVAALSFSLLFLAWLMLSSRGERRSAESMVQYTFLSIGVLLLGAPVCHPWHALWLAPFLCFFFCWSWFYLSCIFLLYYSFPLHGGADPAMWMWAILYIPFAMLLVFDLSRNRLRQKWVESHNNKEEE